jgi:hypothetical protein
VTDDTVKELDENTIDMLNNAQIGITPILGHHYHLYKRKDETYFISLISPEEWDKEKQPDAFEEFVISLESTGDNKWQTV